MKHPEFLILPILMFADYFMTLIGAVQSTKKYGQHFKTEHYELNPVWQTDIARRKWFNPRHLLLVLLISSLLVLVVETGMLFEPLVEAVFGGVLVIFGTLLGKHLSNLLVFGHVILKPEQISGQVTMSHALVLSVAMYQLLVVCVPIVMITIFMPSPLTIGGMVGIATLVVAHLVWITRHRMRAKKSARPDAGEGA